MVIQELNEVRVINANINVVLPLPCLRVLNVKTLPCLGVAINRVNVVFACL